MILWQFPGKRGMHYPTDHDNAECAKEIYINDSKEN